MEFVQNLLNGGNKYTRKHKRSSKRNKTLKGGILGLFNVYSKFSKKEVEEFKKRIAELKRLRIDVKIEVKSLKKNYNKIVYYNTKTISNNTKRSIADPANIKDYQSRIEKAESEIKKVQNDLNIALKKLKDINDEISDLRKKTTTSMFRHKEYYEKPK
jgi:chromosome segregation ATPase